MKLIRPRVEILDKIDGNAIINRIATVARTCYKSENLSTPEKDLALVKRLIESKHEAMIEFADVTVKFTCDRGVANELVRHRIASFAMESTRYCNYSKDKFDNEITFIIPSWLDLPEGEYLYWGCNWVNKENKDEVIVKNRNDDGAYTYNKDTVDKDIFLNGLDDCERAYLEFIDNGCKPEQARQVLPLATKTEVDIKANLREWRHLLKLRCSSAAHPDIRVLALDLLKQLHEQIPVVFDDLYSEYYNNLNN